MPLYLPHITSERHERNNGDIAVASPGTNVTTGGTASTKGTAVELIASTDFDAFEVHVFASGYSNTNTNSVGCLDIMIGTEVIIPDLLMGYCGSYAALGGQKVWRFPLHIPKGVQVQARAAGQRVSTAFQVAIRLFDHGGQPRGWYGTKVDTYGVTVPSGVVVTTANASEGSWAEVTASTSAWYKCVVPSLQINAETSAGDRAVQLDIGMGGSGAEVQIGVPHTWITLAAEAMGGPFDGQPIFQDIPTGSRLVARTSTQSTPDNHQVALHCIR